jgi:tetratricopeptide (TPR) repeat protein
MKSQAIFDTRAIATRLFVLALLFATPRIPASAQELIFDTFMNDASAALKQNKLDDAQRLFASAMNEPYAKEHPGGVLCATYGLAIVKQRNKQYAEAERLLLQAMELLPKDSTAPATRSLLQFTLGKMYAKEGKLETADASLRSALDLSDSANEHFIATPAILTELASIYDREGKKSEARALREKAIELKKVAGTQPIPDTEQTNAQNGAAPSASQAKTDTPVAQASHGTGGSKLTDLEQLDALKAMYKREGKSTFAKDPDGEDAELAAEWLKWRDKVLGVVQSNVQAILNNPNNI